MAFEKSIVNVNRQQGVLYTVNSQRYRLEVKLYSKPPAVHTAGPQGGTCNSDMEDNNKSNAKDENLGSTASQAVSVGDPKTDTKVVFKKKASLFKKKPNRNNNARGAAAHGGMRRKRDKEGYPSSGSGSEGDDGGVVKAEKRVKKNVNSFSTGGGSEARATARYVGSS